MDSPTGNRLMELRRERGMSQEDLAERIGVSRQAVSNWERSESLPDTANLLKLAELFETTMDDLLRRGAAEPEYTARDDAALHGAAHRKQVTTWVWFLGVAAASLLYYLLICPALLQSTVMDVTEVFGLGLGPALAVTWFVAETVFAAVPFLLLAALPARMPRRIWVAPLAAFAAPVLLVFAADLMGGAQVWQYSGAGGALMPSLALKADCIGLAVGCAVASWRITSRSAAPLAPAVTEAG